MKKPILKAERTNKPHHTLVSELEKNKNSAVITKRQELLLDWAHVNQSYEGQNLGTCVVINDQIISLAFYSDKDLDRLRQVVNEAIDHEQKVRHGKPA